MFIEAFNKDRLHGKAPQLLESAWLKAFVRWRSEVIKCGCGTENTADDKGTFACACGKNRRVPAYLSFSKTRIPLYPGAKLFECQTVSDSDDFKKVTAEVVTNPRDPKVLGLKNLSDNRWLVTAPDGNTAQKGKEEVIKITSGIKIDFKGTHTAEITANKKEDN
jgi:hypothetical protein